MEIFLKKLNKCCCCLGINLKIGALIILWLGIIGPSLMLLTILLSGIRGNLVPLNGENAMVDVCLEIVFWFYVTMIILFQFLPHALALQGIYKNKPKYLEPYIFLNLVGLLFSAIFLIILALSMLFVGANYDRLEKQLRDIGKESYVEGTVALMQVTFFFTMVTAVIASAIAYYFTSVVHSQYQMMKEEINKHFGCTGAAAVQYNAYYPEISNSKLQLTA